ncbi:signal recognition particle-docking protein FtsY, partial [Enterococcus faecalis]
MGFFDKIKKAFSAEKKEEEKQEIIEETVDETPSDESAPAESKETAAEEAQTTPETTAEEVTETADLTDNAEMEKLAGVEEALEEEPEEILTEETQEVVVEAPEEESSVVTPLAEPTDTQVSEEIEESKEEQVQEKYEKGLEKTRKTFGQRLNELFANFRSVDEDFFEELEETLIGADVGFDTSLKITEALRQEVKLRNVKKPAQVQNTIIEKMVDLYEEAGINENNAINLQPNGLTVILFVGVNGVGKTTSIGKLAHQYKLEGKKVLMAAADTFRAGAIDQLVVWGERAGVEVVRGNAGGDPAAVVFDAVERAKAEQADVLLVDTAGRLQNKVNLMKELEKIKRVIQREIPDAPHEVLLVVDATTGQNAMTQAKQFKETT